MKLRNAKKVEGFFLKGGNIHFTENLCKFFKIGAAVFGLLGISTTLENILWIVSLIQQQFLGNTFY